MRSRVPRWLGVAALIITATKLGIPAFAQEFEPGEEMVVEETGEVIDPGVEVVDPGVEVVDPGVEVVDPGVEVVDPGVEVIDESGEGTGAGDECVSGPPGLYKSDCQTIADGLMGYEPAYKLWSDGAAKHRYIYLPPQDPSNPAGPKKPIDASNPDAWVFPDGTRLYKTFLRRDETKKYETRIIKKEGTRWSMTTYAWEDAAAQDQKVATLVTAGVENVFKEEHDIPTQAQCSRCHSSPERVLGFSAIQLSPDGTLGELIRNGMLINWANSAEATTIANAQEEGAEAEGLALESAIESYRLRATIQGDFTQTEAVGYLHANCGHCHGGPFPAADMTLFSRVLTDLPTEETASTVPNGLRGICDVNGWTPTDGRKKPTFRIHPGESGDSAIIARMSKRDGGGPTAFKANQMPPLATDKTDNAENSSDGLEKVTAWVDALTACPIPTEEVEAPEAVF